MTHPYVGKARAPRGTLRTQQMVKSKWVGFKRASVRMKWLFKFKKKDAFSIYVCMYNKFDRKRGKKIFKLQYRNN